MSKKRIKDVKLKSGALTYEENGGRLGRKNVGGGGGGQETRRDSLKEHIERSIKKGRR